MKIVIPVTNLPDDQKSIAKSFHNSEYVCIYNDADKSLECLPARKISDNPGNLGFELKRRGIGAVISPQMPLMALNFFAESGLPVFQAKGEDIQENIRLFMLSQLPLLTAQMSKASPCSGSCGSCGSNCNS